MPFSDVPFQSVAAYASKHSSGSAEQARSYVLALKRDAAILTKRGEMLASEAFAGLMADRLDIRSTDILVPIPRSSLQMEGSLWVPMRLAERIAALRGVRIADMLKRTRGMRESKRIRTREERPTPEEHRASLAIREDVLLPDEGRVLLVDDIVTLGSTALGAAAVIRKHHPERDVALAVAVRTLPGEAEFTSLIAPAEGVLRVASDGIARQSDVRSLPPR